MKKLVLLSSLVLSTSLLAAPNIPDDQLMDSFTVEEVSSTPLFKSFGHGPALKDGINDDSPTPSQAPSRSKPDFGDRMEQTGKVIQTAKDMVALGEAIYDLVHKGKPTNVTEYAPISVVPKDPISKEYVDPFDLEGFSMPVEKSYIARLKDKSGRDAVTFNYKVIYSYGGSYNGAGKYLTNVMIVPGSIKTSYGWDFSASMKLAGIMNHGTKADPVAGVMVVIKYSMNSWSAAYERNDTVHITGRGEMKSYMSN